ncbi:MAG: aminopeptidase [Lachnospiraceae bacterium]
MDYSVLFANENESVQERYDLAMERIAQITIENGAKGAYQDYFKKNAEFITMMGRLYQEARSKALEQMSLEELQQHNKRLYEDILEDHYRESYANPQYAVATLGEVFGGILSFVTTELRGMIVYAYEARLQDMTICAELFLQIYCLFADSEMEPSYKEVHEAVYWYVSDYAEITVEHRIREQIDPTLSFATDIIMESDLTDLRYLYRFGEYITENELGVAKYLNTLSEEDIQKMADTFTEGYRKGFILGNKDLSKKKTVNIRYILGFERVVRRSIQNFEKMGLKPTIYRAATYSVNKRQHIRNGYYGAIPNQQMEYDHRFDNALYLDKAFMERKLEVTRVAYEKYKELAYTFAGPAVMETFGANPFEPVAIKEALKLNDKQKAWSVQLANELAQVTNEYIKGEERSFTIIAYPVPEIGDRFEEIFAETVKINTLDYELYRDIQQRIIDVLDQAQYVEVKGQNGNTTDICVSIMQLKNPSGQTAFENCVADVNIPLGEVFTSPVLSGTTGKINVSRVYLNDIRFDNLTVEFRDGKIASYSCDNYEREEDNQALIKQTLLFDHETLPMGEFAIGTNTTAYVMANRYDIVYKLPILIVEKMGPHFAVGDTCYSWAEDTPVYNPDGKEIMARDNEISILRKEDPSKAYFNCHTDITIPYDEIGSITAVLQDGSRKDIILAGRFVLEGCEELNKAFA